VTDQPGNTQPTNDQPTTVEEYLATFPEDVQVILGGVLAALRRALPGAVETIRYGMPALMLQGRYGIHVAGWKAHVGLYPVPRFDQADPALEAEVAPYRTHKDTVRFLYRDPVPYDLVERIAAAAVAVAAATRR
jgi:uncharacterized protein YdhG (YjbR/CyaY superfamily)